MRIKLIFPRRELRHTETVIKHHLVPSETLPALAAVTPPGHTVEIVDENVQSLDMEDVPDLVGITVYTFVAPRAYALARHFRSRGAHVVLGGLHVTSVPDEAMRYADTIFIGEAEVLWNAFLRDLERGKPQRVYGPAFVHDLNELPQPRKALLSRNRYLTVASVSGSRGCPYRCTYCFNSVDPKPSFRQRSVQSIVSQIKTEGDAYYIFFDDNFTVNRDFTWDLCRELGRLNIKWRCAASINLGYDEALVSAMAASGCDSIFIGFESINTGSLNSSSKHHNRRQDYERLIRVFQVVFRPRQMTADELIAGYRWAYREYYSWRSILRRMDTQDLRYGLRTLVFNIALKKMDWVWLLLRRCRLLYSSFHLYHRIERLLMRKRSPARNPLTHRKEARAFL